MYPVYFIELKYSSVSVCMCVHTQKAPWCWNSLTKIMQRTPPCRRGGCPHRPPSRAGVWAHQHLRVVTWLRWLRLSVLLELELLTVTSGSPDLPPFVLFLWSCFIISAIQPFLSHTSYVCVFFQIFFTWSVCMEYMNFWNHEMHLEQCWATQRTRRDCWCYCYLYS